MQLQRLEGGAGIRAGNMQGQRRSLPPAQDAAQQRQAFQTPLPARPQPTQQQQPSQPQQAPQMPQYSTQPRTQPGPTQGALNGAPPLTYLQQGVRADPRNQTGFRNNPSKRYEGDMPAAPAFDFSGLFEASGASQQAEPNIVGYPNLPMSQWGWI